MMCEILQRALQEVSHFTPKPVHFILKMHSPIMQWPARPIGFLLLVGSAILSPLPLLCFDSESHVC